MRNIDIDTISVNGQWWVPGDERKKFPGLLEGCSAKGYRLKLEKIPLDVELEKYDVFFGEASGECISLHQCLIPNPSIHLSFRGIGHKGYNIYAVEVYLGGQHVKGNEVFPALEFEIFGLSKWLVGIEGKIGFLRKNRIEGYFLESNHRVLLMGSFSLSNKEKWNHLIRKITAFFPFIFQKQAFPYGITWQTNDGKFIRNYTHQSIPETPEEPVHARVTLLPFFAIKDRLKRIFARWLEMTDSMATWLYVSSIYRIGFAEHRFLSLTISLEGLYNHSAKQARRDYNYRKKKG